MSDWLIVAPTLAWLACVAVAGITDRDYGRSTCWQREVHDWAVTLALLPALVLIGGLSLLGAIIFRSKEAGHAE